jgi:hypothetical protein
MHIVLGMAVASLLIIGVAVGNLFACVFLSLLPAAYLLLCIVAGTHNSEGWAFASAVLLCVIWAPRYCYIQSYRRAHMRPVPPKSKRAYDAGQATARAFYGESDPELARAFIRTSLLRGGVRLGAPPPAGPAAGPGTRY